MQTLRLATFAEAGPYHAALVTMRPDRHDRTALHRHADFCELMLVLHGTGRHRVNGHRVRLAEHDLIFVRADDQHAIDPVGDDAFAFINVALPIDVWDRTAKLCGFAPSTWAGPTPPGVSLDPGRAARIEEEFRRALLAFRTNPRLTDLIGLIVSAMAGLDRSISAEIVDRERAAPPDWLESALTMMRRPDRLTEGLPALLRLTRVSHPHLARSVRRYYGCTPVEYLTRLRLERASLLLTTTDDPIGAIAAGCGFNSSSYFARQFAAHYGHSAREHRSHPQRMVAPT